MFSYGEFKAEDQEQMLKALNKKVEEVYRNTIGDNEANIRLEYDMFLYDNFCSTFSYFMRFILTVLYKC